MSEDNAINVLSEDEALAKLAQGKLGRVVVNLSEDVDIFPVNYVVHEGKVYFRSAEGTKLSWLTFNPQVIFEADSFTEEDAWSVIVKGEAEVLTRNDDIAKAEELELHPWVPTIKRNFVVITPKAVSGRQFKLGEEPEQY